MPCTTTRLDSKADCTKKQDQDHTNYGGAKNGLKPYHLGALND